MLPQLTLWESGDPLLGTYVPLVTVGWLDFRNYGLNGIDIYAGLLDARAPGMMVNPLGPAGEAICTSPLDQTQLSMDNLLQNNHTTEYAVFAWTHDKGASTDIWTQKINLPTWVEFWPTNGWPVTEAKANQILPQVNREVYVWQDGRRDPIPNDNQDDENIYCQTPGTCTGGTEMLWRDIFAKWSPGEDAQHFRFVADPEDGSTFVVWDEIRYPFDPGSPYRIVFIQKLDKDGVPRWSNAGVAVNKYNCGDCECSPYAQLPDVCIDGAGGARVVWQQTEGAYQACWAAHVQADGTVLFNNSIWASTCGSRQQNFTEPRIALADGVTYYAAVGCIIEGSANNQLPRIGGWDVNDNILLGSVTTSGWTDHFDLRIAYDNFATIPGVYFLTRIDGGYRLSVEYRSVALAGLVYRNESINFAEFGGYDLTAASLNGAAANPAYFTWSEKAAIGDPFEVHLGYFHPSGGFARRNITDNLLASTPPQKPDSKQPVLVCDSIAAYGTHEGVLMAWDTEVYQSGGSSYHKVETNRAKVQFIFPPSLLIIPEFKSHLILDNGLSGLSYPDIARVVNPAPGMGPYGVVVWENVGEASLCQPLRLTDIIGQYVLYDSTGVNWGAQWTGPQSIAPGPGNYHQTRPQVQSSLPGAVSVYWYDGQTGDASVMGTRLPDLNATIAWAKNSEQQRKPNSPSTLSITDIWPQPAGVNTSAIQVGISGKQLEDVTLDIFDLLGRKIATLYRGVMHETGLVVQFTPSELKLRSGVYVLRLHGDSQQVIRTFTVLR